MQGNALQKQIVETVTIRKASAWSAPRSQTVEVSSHEPTGEVAAILIEAWARHALASSGFGG